MDLTELAEAERDDFADLLETLTPQEWDAPSLCTEWTVRDVVAHVLSYEDLGAPAVAALFVRGGFRSAEVNERALTPFRSLTPDQLTHRMREHRTPHGLTAVMGSRIALTDALIHQQDVRRALGRPRSIPAERIQAALAVALGAPNLPARRLGRGVRLVADDFDWAHGEGLVVHGPGEAILMALAGRQQALADLGGPGVGRWSTRFSTAA